MKGLMGEYKKERWINQEKAERKRERTNKNEQPTTNPTKLARTTSSIDDRERRINEEKALEEET